MRFRAMARRTGQKAASRSWNVFEGVLAAHRRTADAAGVDWKSAVYRKIEQE
jgi:hypothetical protein